MEKTNFEKFNIIKKIHTQDSDEYLAKCSSVSSQPSHSHASPEIVNDHKIETIDQQRNVDPQQLAKQIQQTAQTDTLESTFNELADKIFQQGDGAVNDQMNLLSNIVSNKNSATLSLSNDKPNIDKYDTEENNTYYNKYCNLYLANVMLLDRIKDSLDHKEEIVRKLKKVKNDEPEKPIKKVEVADGKKKRNRRLASDIDRTYLCPMPKCSRAYGKEGCLSQHIKLKHRAFWQTYSEVRYSQKNFCGSEIYHEMLDEIKTKKSV